MSPRLNWVVLLWLARGSWKAHFLLLTQKKWDNNNKPVTFIHMLGHVQQLRLVMLVAAGRAHRFMEIVNRVGDKASPKLLGEWVNVWGREGGRRRPSTTNVPKQSERQRLYHPITLNNRVGCRQKEPGRLRVWTNRNVKQRDFVLTEFGLYSLRNSK